MPNTDHTNPGRSLRQRIDAAAKMTARQQQQRRSKAGAAPRGQRGERAYAQGRGQEPRKSSAQKATSKRSTARAGAAAHAESKTRPTRSVRASSGASPSSVAVAQPAAGASDIFGAALSWCARHKVLVVLCVLVLCVALVYPVAQRYYQTMRVEQRYELQQAALESRNAAIAKENSDLKTDEGIESQAREQLGWTKKGEKSAVITNVGSASTDSKLPSQVDLDAIDAPHTWYYNILDTVFFVNTKETS